MTDNLSRELLRVMGEIVRRGRKTGLPETEENN